MSKFTGPLMVDLSSTKERYATLLEPLVWEMDFKGSGEFISIPKGFESDGITVPRILWSILPPWGHPATRAAILHDYLLIVNKPDRKIADTQFYLALKATGVNKYLSYMMYLAVRSYSLFKRK